MNAGDESIANTIDEIHEGGWDEWLSYDRELAIAKGRLVLRFKKTGAPIPVKIDLSKEALEKRRLNLRELKGKIKMCLPPSVLKDLASEANSLLRDANRRVSREVAKDLTNWKNKTADQLGRMFGDEVAASFLKDAPLPPGVKGGSIQAFSFQVARQIDFLKDL